MTEVKQVMKTYRRWTLALYGIYVAINVATIFGLFDKLQAPATWFVALAVSLPVALHVYVFLTAMRDCDEFLRGLMAKRFIVSAGITMALFTFWGFLESYAGVAHAPGFLVVVVFWGLFGLVSPLIQNTHS
jgi:putative oxidoreductase